MINKLLYLPHIYTATCKVSYFFANKNTVYNFSCKKKNNTAYQAYQAGEIDVMDHLPAEQIPQIVAEDPYVIVSADTGAQFLNFNVDKAPFDNR